MVCSFCRSHILESGNTWGYHHYDVSRFKQSLQEECSLCTRLSDDLKATSDSEHNLNTSAEPDSWLDPWLGKDSSQDAVYRWTLRNASAVTRESKDMVVLRFRPNLGTDPAQQMQNNKRLRLPDRAFYFLHEEEDVQGDQKGDATDSRLRPELGRIPHAHQLGGRTDSNGAWAQMSSWMDNCLKHHPNCARKHSERDFVPTRLVDVGPHNGKWPPDTVRVVVTEERHKHSPYVTLSHCWGKDPFVNLVEDNFDEFTTSGVSWEQIKSNQNFVDAILVARKLKTRFIWIDSLCIIQEPRFDTEAERLTFEKNKKRKGDSDFSKEGKTMHKVYRNSYLNISAAASPDKNGGLFKARDYDDLRRIIPEQYVPRKSTVLFKNHKWRAVADKIYEEGLLNKILYTRGWVFQERMLSPRLLHFSTNQIFWECSTITAPESIPTGLPLPLDAPVAAPDRQWRLRLQQAALSVRSIGDSSIETFWRIAVRAYTSCDLGQEKDKLIAIWGVAKLVRDALREDFAAGLWSLGLVEQLCWRVANDRAQRPPALAAFPSWSWMSVRGAIEPASRIGNPPRVWEIEGVDGKEPQFELRERVSLDTVVGKGPTWKEELANMTNRMADMEEHMGAHITAEYKSKSRDAPPELVCPEISIKGHVMKGSLKKCEGTSGWDLAIDLPNEQVVWMEAFPDVRPSVDDLECEFVVLAVSCSLYLEGLDKDELDCLEDDEISEVEYAGTGILVEKVEGSMYKRTGALRFEGISNESWEGLRESCCGRETEGEGAHALEDGIQILLC
ncbi:hypothetical protein B0T10DRAFT_79058 [Thelonectria olida]|uniref:Heterokaryon incompatibility domain-containing protein n=1 Tax=Thelonectria olida TaxID=1576542 RepID=A0A9P9AQJ0_9HYPO|nr:hypothetical protein B0T10DRAFT_79058 [Thelonectria olida]